MKHEYHEGPEASEKFGKTARVFRALKSNAKLHAEDRYNSLPRWKMSHDAMACAIIGVEAAFMTITLPLQPMEEARLLAAARAKGVSADDLLREALNRILADSPILPEPPKAEARPIWEVMLDNIEDISPDKFEKLPGDGAANPTCQAK